MKPKMFLNAGIIPEVCFQVYRIGPGGESREEGEEMLNDTGSTVKGPTGVRRKARTNLILISRGRPEDNSWVVTIYQDDGAVLEFSARNWAEVLGEIQMKGNI